MNNKVLVLKKDSTLQNGLKFKTGQQFEIVMGVIYINGYPVASMSQATIFRWINENPNLFNDVTKKNYR